MKKKYAGGILTAVSLLVASCGGSADEPASDVAVAAESGAESGAAESGSETAATEEPTGPKIDPAVFSGTATTVDGETFELGALADKDLVLWFWAPW